METQLLGSVVSQGKERKKREVKQWHKSERKADNKKSGGTMSQTVAILEEEVVYNNDQSH